MTRCQNAVLLLASLLVSPVAARAQTGSATGSRAGVQPEPLSITKIDPPNWYATLPKPMLLVQGTGLRAATVSLSDGNLRVERVAYSDNGHWAQLWLSASPAKPETVQITFSRGAGSHASAPFTFAAPRPATEGMAGFSQRDVMYLILTDRFADGDPNNDGLDGHSAMDSPAAEAERAKQRGWHGGDLRGVLHHLDYLQDLGITAMWTTPVYQNHEPEAYHGYHATDYYSVDEHYGSLDDLKALAAALHHRGMKLVLDTVPNHVGPGHPWVTDEPAPNWFHGTAAHHIAADYNFDALINPHAPERDRDATLHGWFVDTLPDMNTDDPVVAQYLRQNAIWWIEQTGADGLRIDTFPFVNRGFWHDFNGELTSLFPHLTEVGEVSTPDPEIASAFADGVTRAGVDTGLWTPFDFPLYHATRDVFAGGQPFTRLSRVLEADELYPHPERLVPFLGNHDESRFAEAVKAPTLRTVAYTLLLTTRGLPQLYSGDEIAMPGGNDPDNRRDFPGGFPGTPDAFTAAGRTPEQEAMFESIRQLTKLRREHPALACGREQVLVSSADTLVYTRTSDAACQDGRGAPETLVVALARSSGGALDVQTGQTAVAGCSTLTPLLGRAAVQSASPQFHLTHMDAAVVLQCH